MMLGDQSAIFEGLSHSGVVVRINGIMNAVKFKSNDKKNIDKIISLKSDNQSVIGYTVSQFATAALHVLGIENYNGSDEQIHELIDSEFEF